MNPKLAGWTGFIATLLFLMVGFYNHTEKARDSCLKSYYNTKLHGMLVVDADAQKYCDCVTSKTTITQNLDYTGFMMCYSEYVQEPFFLACENELNPKLKKGAGLILDCSCMYQNISNSSWDIFSNPNKVYSDYENQNFNLQLVTKCSSLPK